MVLCSKKLFCVYDETDILELFRDELQECGHCVLEATNVSDALKLFGENQVDCVISDIRMPGEDGIELAKKIKAQKKDIPVFLVTGFSDYTSEELGQVGVDAVIFKPFDLEEVISMIRGVVEDEKESQ